MGRSSTTKRTQGIPGQHSTKHENGTVGPGRKVQKGGSNGQVNGGIQRQPSEKLSPAQPTSTTTTISTTSTSTTSTPPLLSTPPSIDCLYHKDANFDGKSHNELLRRVSAEVFHDSSSGESYQQDMPRSSYSHDMQPQSDVNCTRTAAVQYDNVSAAPSSSLLTTRPCLDIIAVLLVYLQLNRYLVTISYIIFFCWDYTSLIPKTLDQIWELPSVLGGNVGSSSWKTMVACDFVVGFIWLVIWKPMQQPMLNLASSMIAMSVMNGDTGQRNSDIKNVLSCLGVILVSHFLRFDTTNIKLFNSILPSALTASGVATDDGRLVPPPPLPPQDHRGVEVWIRTILAIHILTQGVVRYTRDWIIRRTRRDNLANSSSDPDFVKGAFIHNENTTNETTTNMTSNGSINDHDIQPLSTLDKLHNSKKKKRAGPVLHVQQPFWRQLGSFKVQLVKSWLPALRATFRSYLDLCLRYTTGIATSNSDDLGNASFTQDLDNIWITNITYDEVHFSTSAFSRLPLAQKQTIEATGMDTKNPFYIRVGKNPWTLTEIKMISNAPEEKPSDVLLQESHHWMGKIYGLSPAQLSHIEFVSTVDGTVLFSTSVQTLQAPMLGVDTIPAPSLSPVVQQSPKTALRTSIATQEAKREDERARHKQQRKDFKSKLSALRREIDRLNSNIASYGTNDDRLRQKLQQASHNAKQADEAADSFMQELNELSNVPEVENSRYKSEKEAWQSQRDVFASDTQSFETFKKDCDLELSKLSAELATYQNKRDGLLNRIKKHEDKMDRLRALTANALAERRQQEVQRATRMHERENAARQFKDSIDKLKHEIVHLRSSLDNGSLTNHIFQQNAYYPHYPGYGMNMSNDSPSYPWYSTANYESYNPNSLMPNSVPSPNIAQHHLRTRGRSSSMLSDVSGFTHISNGDEVPVALPMPRETQELIDRARSEDGNSVSSPTGSAHSSSPALLLASRFVPPGDSSSS